MHAHKQRTNCTPPPTQQATQMAKKTSAPNPQNDLTNEQKHWFAFYVKPNCERKVTAAINKKNIDTCLPLKHETRLWGGKERQVKRPLIPSYVFAHINRNDYYTELCTIKDLVKIVKIGQEIIHITQAEINWLKQITTQNIPVEVLDAHQIKIGQRAKITHGALAGNEGNIVKQHGKCRFGLVISSLQTAFVIDIDAQNLAIID